MLKTEMKPSGCFYIGRRHPEVILTAFSIPFSPVIWPT